MTTCIYMMIITIDEDEDSVAAPGREWLPILEHAHVHVEIDDKDIYI